jgi:predicted alpha/beta hydrolase family esterase
MARFVLVHGAWHGAWCFSALIRELELRGHAAAAVDLPCDVPGLTQHDYARLIGPQPDAILVGHSLAAQTIPHVEAHLRVYLGGLLPVAGAYDEAFAQLRRQARIGGEPAPFGEGDVVIATLRDAAIDPAWQLRTARAHGARVIELDSGHSPFFTQPDELAAVLDRLAPPPEEA